MEEKRKGKWVKRPVVLPPPVLGQPSRDEHGTAQYESLPFKAGIMMAIGQKKAPQLGKSEMLKTNQANDSK